MQLNNIFSIAKAGFLNAHLSLLRERHGRFCNGIKVIVFFLLFTAHTNSAVEDRNYTVLDFDLPAQPANESLLNFARIANQDVLFPFDSIGNFQTNKVCGNYTIDKALELLLHDTGLVIARSVRGNTIIKIATTSRGDNSVNKKTTTAGALLSAAIATASNADLSIEEVIVTAQKRAESVQDVPIAMQAFSGDDINNLGVSKASDITKLAPNLNIATQNAMSQQIVIRGVGTNDFFGNAPGSVGLYMDEVTMSSPFLGGLGLYDMERVEVLRGPQNSLFGRNTTGGAVNYISVAPEVGGEMEGYLRATYGSHDRTELEGAISLPLNDTMALRVSGMSYRRDGIWNNVDTGNSEYGDQDRHSFRTTLRWEPSPDTVVTFNYHNANENSESLPTRSVGANHPVNGFMGPTFPGPDIDFEDSYDSVNHQGLNVSTGDWKDIYKTGAAKSDIDVEGGYLKVVHDFEDVTLSVITAYDEVATLYSEDDGTSGNIRGGLNNDTLVIDMDQEYEQLSAEIRLASSGEGDLRWIAGLYYFSEDASLSQNIRFGSEPSVAFGTHMINTLAFSIAEIENEVISPYLHTDYRLSDSLTLTVGLRYTEDTKKNPLYYGGGLDIAGIAPETFYDRDLSMQLAQSAPVCTAPFVEHCAGESIREDLEFEEWGGKIGLDWQASEELMIYGSYSRGFKSGKFDVEFLHNPYTPFPNTHLDVETLDAYELGFKSDWLEGSMQLNGAIFYSVWKGQQVLNVGPHGPEFINMPESEIMGLELEMKWRPAEHWMISAGLGVMDSEITDATGVNVAQEGHDLPFVLDYSANAVVIRDIPISTGVITLQTDMQYRGPSKVKFRPDFAVDEYESSFEVNARASYVFGDKEQYEISAFADNITEEKRCLQKANLAAIVGVYYCMPNEGYRTYGLQAGLKF